MENNENIKSPQTGGLKLMTVFIAVLALHVLVIGGITVYHLMSGPADPDLAVDKTQKSVKATPDAETATTDAPADKSTPPATVPAVTDKPAPAPVTTPSPATAQTPSGPVPTETVITPPPEPPTVVSSGPVKMPVIEMTPQAPAAPMGSMPYVVKAHDSLAKIAHFHHITVAKLKAANGMDSNLLQIGQKLVIPAKSVATATAPTPDATASPTVLDDSAPATIKPVKPVKPAKVAASTPGHKMYTVVKGDTLVKIAHKFKTTTNAIMAVNALGDAGKISIGQKIRIPTKEARSAANTAPTPETPAAPAAATESDPKAKPAAQLANFMR